MIGDGKGRTIDKQQIYGEVVLQEQLYIIKSEMSELKPKMLGIKREFPNQITEQNAQTVISNVDEIKKENIPSKKSSAQVGVRVNSVLARNDCIKCYISLFKEIILPQFDAFQTEIQSFLTKLCAFKVSRGHPHLALGHI